MNRETPRSSGDEVSGESPPPTKACPACAEQIQLAARVCRYCGFNFDEGVVGTAAVSPVPTTNGMAIASLVLSLFWLGGVGSLLAVIFGHRARKQIDDSGGRQSGRGMAVAGLVLGYIGLILIAVAILAAVVVLQRSGWSGLLRGHGWAELLGR